MAAAADTPGAPVPDSLESVAGAAALGRGPAGALLDAFLRAGDPASLLPLWFGPRAAEIRDDPDALRSACDRAVADLDALLTAQVAAVLRHPAFQRLEAPWRGLALLLDAAGADERVQVRLLSATWDEVARDLDRAADFDRSALFERICEDEFGTAGGLPYGLLVCDVEVRHRRPAGDTGRFDDVSTLSRLSAIASAAFAPCIVGASADLLGVDDMAQLARVRDVGQAFSDPGHARWRAFQARDESRFLAVTAPRMLLRPAHADGEGRHDPFRFEVGYASPRDWLWGNAAYALAANVVRRFRETGWFAGFEGAGEDADGSGVVAGLPIMPFSTGEAGTARRPLEVELTDRRARALEEAGICVLSPCHLLPDVTFLSAPSAHRPATGGLRDATATLRHLLCVGRFAHGLKVIARDRIGAQTSAGELETRLNEWIRGYTIANPDAGEALKARFPLGSARITVAEARDGSGGFSCAMELSPHLSLAAGASAPEFRTALRRPSR